MRTDIKTLADLGALLIFLPEETMNQRPKIVRNSDTDQHIVAAEVTVEPFLVSKLYNDVAGYESELRRDGGDKFDLEDFDVKEPVGTVIFYTGE